MTNKAAAHWLWHCWTDIAQLSRISQRPIITDWPACDYHDYHTLASSVRLSHIERTIIMIESGRVVGYYIISNKRKYHNLWFDNIFLTNFFVGTLLDQILVPTFSTSHHPGIIAFCISRQQKGPILQVHKRLVKFPKYFAGASKSSACVEKPDFPWKVRFAMPPRNSKHPNLPGFK